jgi:hypothetical protein
VDSRWWSFNTRGRIAMSDVVVDDSQSVDVVNENDLLPLSESPGVLADDPAVAGEHAEFPNQHKVDVFEPELDEVAGQETRPDDVVKSADEVEFIVPEGDE